jgi:hypothetical protein
MNPLHWTQVDPLKVTTPVKSSLPMVYTFKYRIGEVFLAEDESIIEITDYNYNGMSYQGDVMLKMRDGKVTTLKSNIIYEGSLNKMERFDNMASLMSKKKKDGVHYRIHFVDLDPKKKNSKEKVNHTDLTMTGIRALCKMLNSMVKRNPTRRIITVSVLDDDGYYISSVKFLTKEIKEQVFLTGMKERLLAHAKYECGYEVATNF